MHSIYSLIITHTHLASRNLSDGLTPNHPIVQVFSQYPLVVLHHQNLAKTVQALMDISFLGDKATSAETGRGCTQVGGPCRTLGEAMYQRTYRVLSPPH